MNKKIISLVAALVFVLGLAALGFAADWGEIIYGGYVSKNPDGTVNADTGIFVFNPNGFPIGCRMQVLDKYGILVWTGDLHDGEPSVHNIPRGGWNWITLGMVVPKPVELTHTTKYMFRLLFDGQAGRAPVVEVKEVIYTTRILPDYGIWEPANIKTWSEAALGGPVGTGKYKP